MTIKEKLSAARIDALRSGDKQVKTSVGYALSAIKQFEVDNKKEVTDNDVIAILKTLVRQRKDSIEKYPDIKELVERDSAEISVLSQYLPAQLSEDEVIKIIRDGVVEAKAVKPDAVFGDVMKLIKGRLNGKTDMSKVKGLVEKELV